MCRFLKAILPVFLISVIVVGVTLSCTSPRPAPATDATLLVSGAGFEFTRMPAYPATLKAKSKVIDFEVFPDRPKQTLAGYGGALNEKGWVALEVLSETGRQKVIDAVFKPGEGLSLNFGRIPIGANDYALSRYSENETAGDLEMKHFSIDRDRQHLIPYARAGLAINPKLRFWASAWTPPTWMKDNQSFDSGNMLDDPDIYAAYALYLAMFTEAYRDEGIPIEVVAVQNEPFIVTDYPSCRWMPEQYLSFIRDHLGPTLARRKSGASIMLGTFNMPSNSKHVSGVLVDAAACSYVTILGLQWDGLPLTKVAREYVPDLPVWQTETDCGNHHWKPGFNPDRPPNDFVYALYTWRNMQRYLAGGSEVYSLWNIILEETGKSIDAKRPWPQNSAIVVNQKTHSVTYTPMFYAFAHYSRETGAGSQVLSGSGFRDALALKRPDGKIAVQLANENKIEQVVRVKLAGRAWDVILPGNSFATLLIES